MAEIIDFTVEKKGYGNILLMWGSLGLPSSPKYMIFRAINEADNFIMIASGYNSAYIDRSPEVKTNNNVLYKIKVIDSDVESKAVMIDSFADPYIYDAAETYLWRLDAGREGIGASAFCKSSQVEYCTECWSLDLNKRIKSNCSTCDGSGMIQSYKGPIPFKISMFQSNNQIGIIGNVESKSTTVGAWTGNLPIFHRDDIIVVGPERYIVNASPSQHKMVSVSNDRPFVIKQILQLLLLDHNHSAYKLGE